MIDRGFYKLPKKRTRIDVAKALEAMGISMKGDAGVNATTLTRREGKSKLKATKEPDGWVYWTE